MSKFKYVIIRSRDAGVFAGYLKSATGDTVVLNKSRRLWYWKGAASLHQLANEGVKCPNDCKFPSELIGEHKVLGVCEIMDATEVARKSIADVTPWTA